MRSPGPSAEGGHRHSLLIVATVLAVGCGLVLATDRLGPPYYAITHLAGYAVVFGYVVSRLRACYRVARTADRSSKLHPVAFWLGLTALGVMGHGLSLVKTGDRDFIRAVTDGCLLFALLAALDLIEATWREAAPAPIDDEGMGPDGGSRRAASAGWEPFQPLLKRLGLLALLLAGLGFQWIGVVGGNWVDAVVGAGLFAVAVLWARWKLPEERSRAVEAGGVARGESGKPA